MMFYCSMNDASLGQALALPANIRLDWKGLSQKFENNIQKCFITLTPECQISCCNCLSTLDSFFTFMPT